MKAVIFILFSILFVISCCSNGNRNKNELFVNDTIRTIIKQYVDKYPQYNTFMLRQSDPDLFCDTNFPHGILLGPGYQDILEQQNCRLFIQFGKARVYMESYINEMLDRGNDEIWENTNPEDTIIINNKPSIDSWHKYIYKAIFIYHDGNIVKVNTRPDTIFIPKRTVSDIKFVPIQ